MSVSRRYCLDMNKYSIMVKICIKVSFVLVSQQRVCNCIAKAQSHARQGIGLEICTKNERMACVAKLAFIVLQHGMNASKKKTPCRSTGSFTNRRRCGYLRLPLPFAGLASEITIWPVVSHCTLMAMPFLSAIVSARPRHIALWFV